MERISKIGLCMCLLLVLAGGCTQTDVEEESLPLPAGTKVDVGFRLNVLSSHTPQTRSITFTPEGTFESDTLAMPDTPTTLPTPATGVGDSVRTKAAAGLTEEQENKIVDLWVGQYNAVTGARLSNEYFGTVSDTKDILLPLIVNTSGVKSHVYFIANAGDLGAVADESTLKEKTLTCTTDAGMPVDNRCRMTGLWEGEVVSGGVEGIPVEMIRLMAKITFTYAIGGDGFTFTPTSVALKNAPGISRVEVTENQLPDISYNTYSGEASTSGATMCWYLAENMAGRSSATVDLEKKKIGTGVTNGTCIELTGNAEQFGVAYKDVTFRFYPGRDMNNYDIERNSHYEMNVTLVGIDLLDERITVGEIPPIEVDPDNIPAEGGEKTVAITTRPGQPWSFTMPDWLTALIGDKTAGGGSTVSDNKPYTIPFTAAVNPTAEAREADIVIDLQGTTKTIHIGQNASTLSVSGAKTVVATASTGNTSTFTATAGLSWNVSSPDWLTLTSTPSGTDNTTGAAQDIKFSVDVNQNESTRSGNITVKVGNAVSSTDAGLTKTIAVTQSASSLTASVNPTTALAVTAGASGTYTMNGTQGLSYSFTAGFPMWLNVTNGSASTSGGTTSGTNQTLTYKTASVNPSSSERSATVTVKAGNISKDVIIKQSASTLSVSGAKTVTATASTGNTSTFTATPGLSWNVGIVSPDDWLVLTSSAGGTDNTTVAAQTITYDAVVNPNESDRQGMITVKVGNAVSGTDTGLTKTIAVTQSASSLTASIDPAGVLAATKDASGTFTMNGTSGLSYTITPTFPSWLTVTNGTASTDGGTTSGSAQTLTYVTASVNPNVSERKATVTVKAGNMTKVVELRQSASSFSITNPDTPISACANSSTTGSITATAGLAWTISPSSQNEISVSPTSGSGDETLTFTGAVNYGAERTGTFIVSVTDASPARTKTFTVTQEAYTPAYVGEIQVCKTHNGSGTPGTGINTCKNLVAEGHDDWYLPSQEELLAVQKDRAKLETVPCFTGFSNSLYISSTPASYGYVAVHMETGATAHTKTSKNIRCVRAK